MVYVLGIACIAWTVIELVRLANATPARVQRRAPARAAESSPAHARRRREPLAAWDDQGRPIFVEDVSPRGSR
jgi:hypothetical protein